MLRHFGECVFRIAHFYQRAEEVVLVVLIEDQRYAFSTLKTSSYQKILGVLGIFKPSALERVNLGGA